jgi:cyclophilin family peptidyl-prolyl cis-trans isomerase/protein-disulfide isomerase
MDDKLRRPSGSRQAIKGRGNLKQKVHILLLVMTGLFILAACSSQSATPTSLAVTEPTTVLEASTPAATCSAVSIEPTLVPDINSFFPPVTAEDFSIGPADAPVTIVEYCDFQSTGCRSFSKTIDALLDNRQDVRFVFRPFPLIDAEGMDKSESAVLAALAADEQDAFWTMYDLLFVQYDTWTLLSPASFDTWIVSQAVDAGLDGAQLQTAMRAPETQARMDSMYEAAKKIGIPAVPLILINGGLQPSYLLDYASINSAVGLIVLGQKQFTTCPPYDIDPTKEYTATLHTEKGDIVIELFADKAPLAVNSFVFLARQGWFDDITFHHVIPGFVAQAGDPTGTGMGNPGYFFNNEVSDLRYDQPGRVGMANLGPDTNGSQFFITFAPAPQLDGMYTVFGQVTSGLEVAELLTPRDATGDPSQPYGDRILSIEVEEK